MKLLPYPRQLRFRGGYLRLPPTGVLYLPPDLPRDTILLPTAERVKQAAGVAGVKLELATGSSVPGSFLIQARAGKEAPDHPEGYSLRITQEGIYISYRDHGGLLAATATLRQILREHGRRLPQVAIEDYPDFPRRGVMLDISRGKVPSLRTLLTLVEQLADFKINEFQLYTEHTFAFRNYKPVWDGWGPITGEEIMMLDARCRQLGIDLVPNQNSFGHLRYCLEYPPLRKLAETAQPYEGAGGTFLRYPSTLAPENRGTLPFLRALYDELLPYFTSGHFNVGCDETWDLGRGQSARACASKGKGRVYLEFLQKIHREVTRRDKRMMFWGDIILHHPELLPELPKPILALNWGYEATHPFQKETALFAQSRVPFYVCPGTSTWMTLIGRLDNALPNLKSAAKSGIKNGALGFLNTDWGDGGHPQPLAISYIPYLAGAALSWCARSYREELLVPVLTRDIFHDPTGRAAKAAFELGFAHRKFKYFAPNVTPFGCVIAAPRPETRELACRDGLKYYARIPEKNIVAAQTEVQRILASLKSSRPTDAAGQMLVDEIHIAGRMALESCRIMLWQQALAAKNMSRAKKYAKAGIQALLRLDEQFRASWPLRNKGTAEKCAPFLRWRIEDYRHNRLHFSPHEACAMPRPS